MANVAFKMLMAGFFVLVVASGWRKMKYPRRLSWIFVLSGTLMNITAVTVNGCKMPVKSSAISLAKIQAGRGEDYQHFVYDNDAEVVFPELTDVVAIQGCYAVASLGDFLILGGVLLGATSLFYETASRRRAS